MDFEQLRLGVRVGGVISVKMKIFHEMADFCYCNGLYQRVRPLPLKVKYVATTAFLANNRSFLLQIGR